MSLDDVYVFHLQENIQLTEKELYCNRSGVDYRRAES